MSQTNCTTTNPRCHGNEIWDKIGYNLACVRDIPEIFAYNRGFRGWATGWRPTNSTTTNPVAMATKFETKQAITPLVQKISRCRLRLVGGIRGWAINDVRQILPQPTPLPYHVAMATKFKTKSPITRLV